MEDKVVALHLRCQLLIWEIRFICCNNYRMISANKRGTSYRLITLVASPDFLESAQLVAILLVMSKNVLSSSSSSQNIPFPPLPSAIWVCLHMKLANEFVCCAHHKAPFMALSSCVDCLCHCFLFRNVGGTTFFLLLLLLAILRILDIHFQGCRFPFFPSGQTTKCGRVFKCIIQLSDALSII